MSDDKALLRTILQWLDDTRREINGLGRNYEEWPEWKHTELRRLRTVESTLRELKDLYFYPPNRDNV